MTTSLSQQLQRLAVPQTSTLSQDKKKPSLLFDPKEAANFDRDTIFCIGVNGLEELALIDSSFQEFEDNLFNETSKGFVRSIQTPEVNKKLDETLGDFLHRVSPFALLRAAHKTLEWLIHRFHIHLYNADALVACFLPYHGTNVFVRIVQLLDLRQSSHFWYWLKPIQESGVALAKSAIINYCSRNLGFLKFVCEMATPAIKENDATKSSRYQTLFSFYSSTVVGVLHEAKTVKEEVVSLLLPFILGGLKSVSADAKCTSYMIIGQLASKAKLKEDIFEALVSKIIQSTQPDCKQEVVMCLAAVYQHQPYNTIPMSSVIQTPFLDNLVDDISALSERHNIDKLLSAIVPGATKAALYSFKPLRQKAKLSVSSNRLPSLTSEMIRMLSLPDIVVKQVISLLLTAYAIALSKKKDTVAKMSLSSFVGNMLLDLETRYPAVFDIEVEERTQALARHYKLNVNTIMGVLLQEAKIKHTDVADYSDTRLYLSLNHPKRQLRKAAVTVLLDVANTSDAAGGQDYIRDALVGRLLTDDSHLIVSAILKKWKILQQLMSADALLDALSKVLQAQQKNKDRWKKVIHLIIKILCDEDFYSALSDDGKQRTTILLLPFLLPTEPSDLPYVIEIYENSQDNVLFTGLYEELKEHIDNAESPFGLSKLCLCTITAFAKRLMEQSEIKRLLVIQNTIDACSVKSPWRSHYRFLALGLIAQLIIEEKDEQRKLILAKISLLFILECLAESSPTRTTCNKVIPIAYDSAKELLPVIDCCLKEVGKGMMPFEAVALTMKNLIEHVQLPKFLLDQKWWQLSTGSSLQGEYIAIQVKIFDFITNQKKITPSRKKKNFRLLMNLFVQTNCPKIEHLLHFLMMMCTFGSADEVISVSCRAKALNVTTSVLQFTTSDLDWILQAESTIVPSLLVALNSPFKPIRKLALDCFQSLTERRLGNLTYSNLVEMLSQHREEIELDAAQFPQILGTYFSPESVKGKSRKSHQPQVLDLLVDYIVNIGTPCHVSAGILQCLAMAKTEEFLQKTVKLLERLVDKMESDTIMDSESSIVELLLQRFTPDKALFIGQNDAIFTILKHCLLSSWKLPGTDVTCQHVALKMMSKEFFEGLPEDCQQQILTLVIDLMVDSPAVAVKSDVGHVLRKLSLRSSQIIAQLNKFTTQPVAKTVRQAKRLRGMKNVSSIAPYDLHLNPRDWRRLECILEMLQNKKKIVDTQLLVPVLFSLLKNLLELEKPEAVEYTKQLVLSCIHHCCLKLSTDGETIPADILKESQLNVELIVQCLRLSGDPQTHNHALLLLGLIAKLFPEHVLHNTMAIFTFMGTSLLRQDDRFSFMIMARTIKAIIPAITKASWKDDELNPEAEKVIILILRIFVDAFPDIPAHRRLLVFVQLMQTLNANLFLGAALGLLMEHHVVSGRSSTRTAEGQKNDIKVKTDEQLSLPVQFALDLSAQFKPPEQVRACIRLMQFLSSLPIEKEEKTKSFLGTKRKRSCDDEAYRTLFDVSTRSAKELRHFKYITVVFISTLLGSKTFIKLLADLSERKTQTMEPLYQLLLNETLRYSNQVSHAWETFSQQPSAKFWKTLNHKTYDILDKVNSLLPSKTFIGVITGLMENDLSVVRRKAMELLNSRLQQQPDVFREESQFLLSLLDPLLVVVNKKVKSKAADSEKEDMAVNKQTALLSLKIICRLLGSQPLEPLKLVLEAAIKSFNTNISHTAVCANSVLCIVELCSCLRAHSISYLHKFMPGLMELLEDQKRLENHELLLLSVVTAVHRLTEILPHFLSPYIQQMLTEICIIATTNSSNSKPPVSLRLKAIRHNIATLMPVRVVLPAIRSCHDELLTKCPDAIKTLMLVLNETIAHMTPEDRTAYLSELHKFFLEALDYRTQHQEESLEKIASMESYVMEPILTTVMKLSEVTFRPLFLKLYNWATSEEAPSPRCITFYCLAGQIAEKLKSLFVLFAGPLVKHAATLLSKYNSAKGQPHLDDDDDDNDDDDQSRSKACLLLELVLDCMCKCFLYDSEGFVNQERFDTLMQPLVDQIENEIGSTDAYKNRIVDHLAPCIAQFAVAASDDASWKQLNYQILLKTRHSSPMVRFAALQVVQELNRRLEKDYLPLLPETIPFLAELMEDESSEVEQQCQTVITGMESILGESLQKYF